VEAAQQANGFFIRFALCELFNLFVERIETLDAVLHFGEVTIEDIC